MNKKAIQELYEQENAYWWHRGRRFIIASLLKRMLPSEKTITILDVGCGTGINLSMLQEFGKVSGIDISSEAVQYCKERGFKNVFEGNAENLPFREGSFDLICAIEMLEHIQDDKKALGDFARVLSEDGKLCITVPAHQFLWSEHDEALDHVRRYSRAELIECLNVSGFEVDRVSFIVTFTFPLICAYRFLTKFSRKDGKPKTSYVMLPKVLDDILTFSLFVESKLLLYFRLPFGASIICVARKKQSR